MRGIVVIQDAKVLNICDKTAKAKDGSDIKWTEIVFMNGSDVNTVTINKNVADELQIDEVYDLLLEISEQIRSTQNGRGYVNHKFRITGVQDYN